MISMVEELLQILTPFLAPAKGDAPKHLSFTGHSLGGSLASLLCCLARTRLQAPASHLHSFAFGSPPVLSLAQSSNASDILQVAFTCFPVARLVPAAATCLGRPLMLPAPTTSCKRPTNCMLAEQEPMPACPAACCMPPF